MKIRFLICSLLLSLLSTAAWAQMTDDQVVSYVQSGLKNGKSEQQLGRELLSRGVTRSQLERLKSQYDANGYWSGDKSNSNGSVDNDRRRTATQETGPGRNSRDNRNATDDRSGRNGRTGDRTLPRDGRPGAQEQQNLRPEESLQPTPEEDAWAGFFRTMTDTIPPQPEQRIFGHDLFTGSSLSFEPNENLATPANYKLGPGDEVIIDIWGANEDNLRERISPEGNIIVAQLGPVYLNGLTIQEANAKLRQVFAYKYAGVGGDDPESDISITLGQLRTIQLNVLGEVAVPGSYRLSPFATLFHALYQAGGVTPIGSLRAVEIHRNGKLLKRVDVYDYLFSGKLKEDIRLEEGDVVIVPPYRNLVEIEGNVKRPMYYETTEGETLSRLLEYAGGFTGDAYTGEVRVVRQTGREQQLSSVRDGEYGAFALEDGDRVTVSASLDRFSNRVEVRGAVYRPGMYELGDGIRTVGELVRRADGATEDAFLARALLSRESSDMTPETVAVDLRSILDGRTPDVELRRNDVLFIPSQLDLTELGALTIYGEVARPGNYPYALHTTLEDLIVMAGGLRDGASTARIEVSRRLTDADSEHATKELAQVYSFSIRDGLVFDGQTGFELKPFDVVIVRKSPGYQKQRTVEIEGEVSFSGTYTLVHKNERLSDLVRRAGGVTDYAYLRGARLLRRMNDEEKAVRDETLQLALRNSGSDSLVVNKIALSDTYSVGIELDKALLRPGTSIDMVLREGDKLIVPEEVSTVAISGDVMRANSVLYQPGKSYKYYIAQAGGYGDRAKKGSVYIIYMNGMIAKAGSRGAAIEPGCTIIVPTKRARNGQFLSQILGVATTAASLGTMAASIANLAK